MWVGLFYPLSKYTSAPHRSQLPLSLLCRRGEHGYPGIKAPLASGSGSCPVPGAPAAPAQNPKPRCPGEEMGPGRAGVTRLGPNRAAKGRHQQPGAGTVLTPSPALPQGPATARLPKTGRLSPGWAACFLCSPLSAFPVFRSFG